MNEVAEIVETDPESLAPASDFRAAADFWSSLTGFSLLSFMEERYGVFLSFEEFVACVTIEDLYLKIPHDTMNPHSAERE
ncbi:MAG: acyl carrier protein [Synergistaceae bacterium]|jgi:acyl carrier protein|nr:acyl carrier protein [Synergistaceae bacterium]